VFENLILVGSGTGEQYDSPPGDLRAFDVVTGALVWTFHTIPHPGEFGYDTWPSEAWKYVGGANAWGEITVDEARGIAYFPLGSPTYDFYGADRQGANLFGNCLLALDARTGKRLWHFQAVHHDLWDYDLAAAPKLLTLRRGGKPVDVVVQPTKTGFLYVLDRVTGEPFWPIEERPVPKSDMPGESAWPTQPFPVKPPPFSRQSFRIEDLNPYLPPAETTRLHDRLARARNEGLFTPPTTRFTVGMPGQLGGANWAATAGDPETHRLYVRAIDLPTSNRLSLARPVEMTPASELRTPAMRGSLLYRRNCAACHGRDRARLGDVPTRGLKRFRLVVKQGQGQMPGFTALTEKEIDALFAFLSTRLAAEEKEDEAPPTEYVEGKTRYYGHYANLITAADGLPAIAPPWSELVAYDLDEGTIRWRVPLGTVPSLAARGIKDTGSFRPTRNGPVVTAGGLIFLATAGDGTLHAYDKDTGAVLWEHKLDANPDGIPAVYAIDGREYVAFFATAGRSAAEAVWKPAEAKAQGYYVFALPRDVAPASMSTAP
jgi:quinoprotein glucose dehydrogenase